MRLLSDLLRRTSALLGLLCLLAGTAGAHAIIVESTPKMNEVVAGPVLDIKLRFNVRIDGDRSKLTLIFADSAAHPVDLARQAAPDSLTASVSHLLPGSYKLHWQVLANDGHITQGDIPFQVAKQ